MSLIMDKIAADDSLLKLIERNLPAKTSSVGNCYKFDCPSCLRRGYTVDRRKRGAVFHDSGGVGVFCFNCNLRTRFVKGQRLGREMSLFVQDLGAPEREIAEISWNLWKYAEIAESSPEYQSLLQKVSDPEFTTSMLPNGSRPIGEILRLDDETARDFLDVAEYVQNRLGNFFDFHWSPDIPRRFIIPLMARNRIVGWTARAIDATEKERYTGRAPRDYIYNTDAAFRQDRKYILVVDSPLDAVAISGVATMGARISDNQAEWLNRQNRNIILVPDSDKNGEESCQVALRMGWSVSFPRLQMSSGTHSNVWAPEIKDSSEAASHYGRVYTVMSILASVCSDPNDIILQSKVLRRI